MNLASLVSRFMSWFRLMDGGASELPCNFGELRDVCKLLTPKVFNLIME